MKILNNNNLDSNREEDSEEGSLVGLASLGEV